MSIQAQGGAANGRQTAHQACVLLVRLLPARKVRGAEPGRLWKVLAFAPFPPVERKIIKGLGEMEEEGGRGVLWTRTRREQRK